MSEQTNIIGNKDFNVSKILKQGRVTIPGKTSVPISSSGALSVVVNHNFGFVPTFQCHAYLETVQWWTEQKNNVLVTIPGGYYDYPAGNEPFYFYFAVLADSSNLTIYNNWTSYGVVNHDIPAIEVQYRLYEDTA